MTAKSKRQVGILLAVLFVLLIPLVAMPFTSDVNWDFADFIVAGGLLLITGFSTEYLISKVRNIKTRMILASLVIVLMILIWIELAVGLFGTPLAGS
jgi:ABC-type cobalt transport system substrate-binding protein